MIYQKTNFAEKDDRHIRNHDRVRKRLDQWGFVFENSIGPINSLSSYLLMSLDGSKWTKEIPEHQYIMNLSRTYNIPDDVFKGKYLTKSSVKKLILHIVDVRRRSEMAILGGILNSLHDQLMLLPGEGRDS